MNIKERIRALWESVTKGGKPFRCASCKNPITDPQTAIATEVQVDLGDGEPGPVYVACCSELCLRRVRKRGVGPVVIAKADGE